MKSIEFKFSLDQTVTTPFDQKGIVTMQAVDDGGNCYFVKTQEGGNWFKEGQLAAS